MLISFTDSSFAYQINIWTKDVKSHNSLSDNESGKPEKKGRNNAFDGNKELNLDFSIGTFGVNMPR